LPAYHIHIREYLSFSQQLRSYYGANGAVSPAERQGPLWGVQGHNGLCDRPTGRCSDKVRVGCESGWFMICGQEGESERFRCVGITLAEIYENTTTRRDSSVWPAAPWWAKNYPSWFRQNYATL